MGPDGHWSAKFTRRHWRKAYRIKLKSAKDLRCPVLIVAAGRDLVVDIEATYRFSHKVTGVSMVVIREALHEIMLERNEVRAQFLAAFDAFVDEKA